MAEKTWSQLILKRAESGEALPDLVDELLANQRLNWSAFSSGEKQLLGVQIKEFSRGDRHIIVQANPGRQISTNAKVDAVSIAKRPCFLCVENMPPAERGVSFGEFVLLPNPFPIQPRHLTIPVQAHEPQKIAGRVEDMLELARALGPNMLVFYNGPRCGASAPDHFHFQACESAGVPLLADLSQTEQKEGVFAERSFNRRLLACRSKSSRTICEIVQNAIEVLAGINGDTEEPLLNLITTFRDGHYLTCFFPRARHRPECYFAEHDSRLAISPAALEMAGILVVADTGHFDRVDEEAILAIYDEVSLDEERFTRLLEEIT